MARVPVVQSQFANVDTQPLANITQNASATAENMGAAEGRALEGFGKQVTGVANQFDQIVQKKQYEQDERAALDALTKLRSFRRTTLYGDDQNPGYLSLQGENAVRRAAETDQSLVTHRDDIAKNLQLNNRARLMFDKASGDLLARSSDTIVAHSSQQRSVANRQVSEAAMTEALDLAGKALYDPHAQDEALGATIQAYNFQAERNGVPAEARKSGLEAAITQFHTKVIGGYLAVEDPAAARMHFEAAKKNGKIDGSAIEGIERSIRAGIAKQESKHRDAVNAVIDVEGAGKVDPNFEAVFATVGPKFQQKMLEARADRVAVDQFIHKPFGEQQAELQAYGAKTTSDPVEVRQMQRKSAAHQNMVQQINAGNGLHVAAGLGYIEAPSVLNYSDPETLAARRRQAEEASRRLGVPVSVFTPQDVSHLENALERDGATEAANRFAAMAQGFGYDHTVTIAGMMAKGQRPEYAAAVLRSLDSPDVATGIITGGRLRREHGQNLQITAEDRREAINSVYGDMFAGTEGGPIGEFVTAADALYASRRIPTGDFSFDSDAYARALRDVSGGIVTFNGRSTIPPHPSMDGDDLADIVGQLTEQDLISRSRGGAPVAANGEPLGKDLFTGTGWFGRKGAQLIPRGPGVYAVMIPGLGLVADSDRPGQPYEISLSGMRPKTGYRSVTKQSSTQVP